MKSILKIASVFLGIGPFTAGILLGPVPANVVPVAKATVHQDDVSSWSVCSAETIRGKYATLVTGSIVSAGPVGLVADVGLMSFDGISSAAQVSTVSLNGAIIEHRASLSGSYAVNPDCTGNVSLTLPSPTGPIQSTSDFVIVNHGQELRIINTGNGRVLAGTARRQ